MSMPEIKKMSFSSLRGGCRALILLALAFVPAVHANYYFVNLVVNGAAEMDISNGWVNSDNTLITQMNIKNAAYFPTSVSSNGGDFFDYYPGTDVKSDSLTQLIDISNLESDIATGRVQFQLTGEANKYYLSGRAILRIKQLANNNMNATVLREDSVECHSHEAWERLEILSSGIHPATRALKVVLDFRVQGTEMDNIIDFDDIQLKLYRGPALTTTAATGITGTTATLGGNISDPGDFSINYQGVVYSSIQANPMMGWANVENQAIAGTGTGAYSTSISSLVPNTTYFVQAYARNYMGTRYGGVQSFSTPAIVPTVTGNAVSALSATAATLNATVNANNANTTVIFEYGPTTSYGTTASASPASVTGTANTAASLALTGLVPNTIYHYRAVGTNIAGTAASADMMFMTPVVKPTVSSNAASSITATGATLNATVNANNASTAVSFEYGTTTSYGTVASADPATVTGTASTAASLALTGLVPNTTYHYRVKGVNVAGTADGADLTFTTPAVAPTATSNVASSITSSSATLNATVNANNASTTVRFEVGLTSSYGITVIANPATVNGTANTAASVGMTGLIPNTTYYYRVKAVNAAGTTYGSDMTFTSSAVLPTVNSGTATSITATSATLNATVNPNNAATTVRFEYGTTTSYGTVASATPASVIGTTTKSASLVLTGLIPNTTYHYRVKGENIAGTVNGSDLTFTTPAVVATVVSDAATNVGATVATLNATVNPNNATTIVSFEYGTTTSYGTTKKSYQDIVTGTTNTPVYLALTGLIPNTTYHYRVSGVNAAGTANGSDMTFTTSAVLPTVASNAATSVTATGATLNATVNANNAVTTVRFEYGTTTSYGTVASAAPASVTGTVSTVASLALTGLIPNTTYHYRVKGENVAGTADGVDLTFTTPAVVATAVSAAATRVGATTATLNATVNANNTSTNVSFEYGTSTAYGTEVTFVPSAVDGTSLHALSQQLTGLAVATTYHYRIKAVNSVGTSYGNDQVFTTLIADPVLTTEAASNVSSRAGTLQASVNAKDNTVDVHFEYGVTDQYGTSVVPTPSSITGSTSTAVSYPLTGLAPNTTYHYRIVSALISGDDMSFTTPAALPVVATGSASGSIATGVTLQGSVNAQNASTTVSFEYGTDNSYGSTVAATPASVTGSDAQSVSAVLSGLKSSTTYHYRIVGVNSAGTQHGDDASFTTPDTQVPLVMAVALPESKTYLAGDVLSFQVEFTEAVQVTGTPALALQIGSATVQALYSSGSGTRILVFQYVVQGGESDADGISLLSELVLNAGAIADAAGNQAVLAVGAQSTSGIVVGENQSAIYAAEGSLRGATLRYTQGTLYVQVPANAGQLRLALLDVHGRTWYNKPVGDCDFVMAIPAVLPRGSIAVLSRRGQVLATQPLSEATAR